MRFLHDTIEVDLHYNTPDNGYIELIKINGELKWDRNSFAPGEVPSPIRIDSYLDRERFKDIYQQ